MQAVGQPHRPVREPVPTSSSTRPPSNRPRTTRPLSAPRSTAAKPQCKVEDLLEPPSRGGDEELAMSACQRVLTSRRSIPAGRRRNRPSRGRRSGGRRRQEQRVVASSRSPERASISGHTSRWRALYSSSLSGRTRMVQHTRPSSGHCFHLLGNRKWHHPDRRRGGSHTAPASPQAIRPLTAFHVGLVVDGERTHQDSQPVVAGRDLSRWYSPMRPASNWAPSSASTCAGGDPVRRVVREIAEIREAPERELRARTR